MAAGANRVVKVADTISVCCATALLAVILLSSLVERRRSTESEPCEEMYVVGEGETLHTISAKCNDPFIVERNPQIYDPDDVYPGLVLTIVPLNAVLNDNGQFS